MIEAAIDVGSNSVRMLIQASNSETFDAQYFREVTRLAGDFDIQSGLAPESMNRTLHVLEAFAKVLDQQQVDKVRVVGTAALRQAVNADEFTKNVTSQTGLTLEIISGETEAALSCRGILSVLKPIPQRALLFDIGGGSTEVILFEDGKIHLQQSYPLGAVRLFEDFANPDQRLKTIQQGLTPFVESPVWQQWQEDSISIELIGTAGTVSTLAALKLGMLNYEGNRVNNLALQRSWLEHMDQSLPVMSLGKREALPGMEKGRADVILPGLQVVIALLEIAGCDSLRVADAGLLEGLLIG